MISMTLPEFTDVVRKVESIPRLEQCAVASKKSNGISDELGRYLDSLSDPVVMNSEVERLSNEVMQLLKDNH